MESVFSSKEFSMKMSTGKIFRSWVVLDENNKAICYLDHSLGEQLELSLNKYRRQNYKVVELMGMIEE